MTDRNFRYDLDPRGGGGVLPYVTLTGMCGPIGYGFQGVLSGTRYLFHHLHDLMA